jgi:hypothetical protein
VTIFGVAWNDLELDHVEAFLADAGGESLTWEAKGRDLPRPASISKHVCGFANGLGDGYLFLGFEREDGAWRTTGLDFPGEDPPVWVTNIVGARLRPRPRVDVRDWPVAGRRAAVVEVHPVGEPPCLTTDGEVFQRVAGATNPVREAAELRRLYDRGETAVAEAEAAALRAADEILATEGASFSGPTLLLSIAVAPIGTSVDIGARVFARDTEERLRLAVHGMPHEPLLFEDRDASQRAVIVQMAQDSVSVSTSPDFIQSWQLRVAWDGSAAIKLSTVVRGEARDQHVDAGTFVADVDPADGHCHRGRGARNRRRWAGARRSTGVGMAVRPQA